MRRIIYLVMTALLIWACSPAKEGAKSPIRLAVDSIDSSEYEIIIVDLKFDQWYLTNFNEAKDHSEEYYRTFNLRAVPNWNEFFRNGKYEGVVDCFVEYWPNTDYGIEVNRKLFWYFKYIETTYGIRLFR